MSDRFGLTLGTLAAGRYRVGTCIGAGATGDVYHAEQIAPVRRPVALKVIKPGLCTPQQLRRFDWERQTLARLSHPGIAAVFDAGSTDDGWPFLVMEYVDGQPITESCDGRRLTIEERLLLMADVCQAVQHAHNKGIIHRDLKPSNILVVDREPPAPKVIDFGIAKALQPEASDSLPHTEHGVPLGTRAYMSPEQSCVSGAVVDTRSDIYSLGLVLREVALGIAPTAATSATWSGGDMAQAASEAAGRRRTDARRLRKWARGDLRAVLLKALEEDPERRYSTAAELAAELRRVLAGEPVMTRADSVGYRLSKLVRRNKAISAVVGAAVLSFAVGLGVSAQLFLKNKRQRDDIFRLSDQIVLERVIADADGLWPAIPANVPRMEAWFRGPAADLLERLPLHRQKLREFAPEAADVSRNDAERQFRYLLARDLVGQLERFAEPERGLYDRVRGGLRFARSVRTRSIDRHRGRWDEAIASIADPVTCPAYGGMRLEPQLGLVPIGRDPRTGLWEFAHIETGDAAVRAPSGNLVLEESSGLVLILLPGGTFDMGAVRPSPSRPAGPNVDPAARNDEGPVHSVTIGRPFFISKYEMTQGQCLRVAGSNPSEYAAGGRHGGSLHTLLHPVENVSWTEAERMMRRLGLVLPTEAQWEYAARGGTTTARWTGEDEPTLAGAANIVDRSCWEFDCVSIPWPPPSLMDGFAFTSPVDRFRPNPFGLHDVIGNVHEWVRDVYASFEMPTREADGLRLAEGELRVFRGGSFGTGFDARIGRRIGFGASGAFQIGVRPARVVEGWGADPRKLVPISEPATAE